MNKFQSTLADLAEAPGVKGCAVVTADGMTVAERLGDVFGADVIAALTSFLVSATNRSLQQGGLGAMSRYTLHCTNGKMLVVGVGEAFLVVVLDQFADLGLSGLELESAVQRLTCLSQIRT